MYVGVNPNMMIIFDDCESFFREHQKDSIIAELIMLNAYHHLTRIFTFQCDRHLFPAFRRNMNAMIFTTSQNTISHFSTVSNGYDRHTRKIAESVISRIFRYEYGLTNYRKLAFFPGAQTDKFQCILANKLDIRLL